MDTPQLTHCFFQLFLDDSTLSDVQPILQIIEVRALNLQGQSHLRARLSDGLFSYSGCTVMPAIVQRFQTEGLSSNNAIIQVTNWTKSQTSGKSTFNIIDYELLSLDFPVLGNPQAHSGRPEDYRLHMQSYTQNQAMKNIITKEEPENAWGTNSNKRARCLSPSSDSRQPLSKRQPVANKPGIVPISLLTPYCNKWRICGIVTAKDQQIKEINNPRGNFRVFGFIITDQAGNSIRVSAFGESAEKFFPLIQNGQVYYISGGTSAGSVRAANKQYSNTGHDYELRLDRDSEVTYCTDEFETPKMKLKPILISNVPQHGNECVDVQAIVDRVGDVTQVTSRKDQRQLNKRDVFLVDKSGVEICFTLWNELSINFNVKPGTVIGVKSATVREFNGGYSISSGMSTQLIENPEGEYTQQLNRWYREQKPNQEIKTLSTDSTAVFERDFHLIGQIIQHGIDQDIDKGQYFYIKAMVNAVKAEQAIYQACPTKNCRKKVIMEGTQYRCEKCNDMFDHYLNIMMLQVELADFTGTAWVTIFEEVATNLLQINADQLEVLRRDDPIGFDAVFNKIRFNEFIFRVRVKYETYNDQQQLKWTVYDFKPVPFDKCMALYQNTLREIEQLEEQPNDESFYN